MAEIKYLDLRNAKEEDLIQGIRAGQPVALAIVPQSREAFDGICQYLLSSETGPDLLELSFSLGTGFATVAIGQEDAVPVDTSDEIIAKVVLSGRFWIVRNEKGVLGYRFDAGNHHVVFPFPDEKRDLRLAAAALYLRNKASGPYPGVETDLLPLVCPECGEEFLPTRWGQTYDKRLCAAKVGERRRRQERKGVALSLQHS